MIKTTIIYSLMIVAGLAVGYGAAQLPRLLSPSYVEGDYSSYYQANMPKVVLYGTSWCPACAKTREFFKSRNVAFVDMDVEKQVLAAQHFKKLGGTAYPVILIGGRRVDGFIPDVIDSSLKLVK